ncbi:MAG TPA: hypothetical protein VF374_00180 [Thermoplasmata archaeon]
MLSLERYSGTELRWFRSGLMSKMHELVDDNGATYAKLTVEGVLTSHARLETGLKQYMLTWSGLIRRRIKIIDLDAGQQLGELYLGVTDAGEFRLDGRTFKFDHDLLGSVYTVSDEQGNTVFSIKDRILGGKGLLVTLGPDARTIRELLLLICTARYAMIMFWQEAFVVPATA